MEDNPGGNLQHPLVQEEARGKTRPLSPEVRVTHEALLPLEDIKIPAQEIGTD